MQLLLFQSLASIIVLRCQRGSRHLWPVLHAQEVEENKKEQIKRLRAKKELRAGNYGSQRTRKAHKEHAITCCRKGISIISFHAMNRSLEKTQPFCHSILFQRLSFTPEAVLSLMTLILSTHVSIHRQRRDTTEEQNSSCASEKPTFLSSH